MTKRQAINKAQDLANETGIEHMVISGAARRDWMVGPVDPKHEALNAALRSAGLIVSGK
jgi:methionine synthase II (cobalamin-independent)